MKISLILPPHSLESRYNKALSRVAGSLPPLGLLYLAAVLKKDGHTVRVFDGSKISYEQMIKYIVNYKPDIIGISVLTFLWPIAKRIIVEFNQIMPDSFIIAGGVHTGIYREQCLKESPGLKAIVIGEGEETIRELIRNIYSDNKLVEVKGIIFRSGDKLIKTPPRERIKNLETLPFPDRDLVNILDYTPAIHQYKLKPVTNIITSRGCPFSCLFCVQPIGKEIIHRSAENIVEEIILLKEKYGIRDIAIWDDTFTLDKERVLKFTELLRKKRLKLVWSVQTRVNTVDKEMLCAMAEDGCWKIFYGVESMLEKNLKILNKQINLEQIYNAIRWTKEVGIEVETSFIFGTPGETYEEGLETIRLCIKLDPDYAKFFPLTFFGKLPPEAAEHGRIVSNDLSLFQENRVTYIPNSMTKEQLSHLLKIGYRKFYLRPTYMWKYARKINSIHDLKKIFRGLQALIKL